MNLAHDGFRRIWNFKTLLSLSFGSVLMLKALMDSIDSIVLKVVEYTDLILQIGYLLSC